MNITEEIKRLADKEREVRKLEMMIEHIASLSDEDLAKVLATLASARKHSVANAAPPLRAAITQHELLRETRRRPVSATDASGVVHRRFTEFAKNHRTRSDP